MGGPVIFDGTKWGIQLEYGGRVVTPNLLIPTQQRLDTGRPHPDTLYR